MDANWLTATSPTAVTDLRVSFPTPPSWLTIGAGLQAFRLALRKTTGTPNPTVNVELWENGGSLSTLLTATSITSTLRQTVVAPWNVSLLASGLGAVVECRVVSTVGSTPGALPIYGSSGTAFSGTATGAQSINVPSQASGDLLLLVVHARASLSNGTITSIGAGWTQIGGAGVTYGGAQICRVALAWKIGSGSDTAVSVTFGGTSTVRFQAQVHKFTAANGFAAVPVANVGTATTGTSTTVTVASVTPSATNQLAVAVIAAGISTTMASATGETGGDWTEPLAEAAATNGTLAIQTSDQSSGGAISGGTLTITSANWVSVAVTLVPANIVNTVEVGAIEWVAAYSFSSDPANLRRRSFQHMLVR